MSQIKIRQSSVSPAENGRILTISGELPDWLANGAGDSVTLVSVRGGQRRAITGTIVESEAEPPAEVEAAGAEQFEPPPFKQYHPSKTPQPPGRQSVPSGPTPAAGAQDAGAQQPPAAAQQSNQ